MNKFYKKRCKKGANKIKIFSKTSCTTAKIAVIYTHRQTTQTAENMINQLTAFGRIGAKK
nr:MAG TPA: hypothetical protein [Caudoviricetes sp.]DAX53554.1 MAG TPA: hypothetical protein [Caudoviricetes sp.]